MLISRRFLTFSIGAVIGSASFGQPGAAAPSAVEAVLPTDPPKGGATQVWTSPGNCYFNYPHSNGFVPRSGLPVIAQRGGKFVNYFEWNFKTGDMRPLLRTAIANMYYDIAEGTGALFAVDEGKQIVTVSTNETSGHGKVIQLDYDESQSLENLVSVTRAGNRLLYATQVDVPEGQPVPDSKVMEFDLRTGKSSPVCDMPFLADHQHYCPADENWIGFSHEGDISKTLDRVWGIHRRGASTPRPAQLWDEKVQSGTVIAGHERWAFHKPGAVVVAYRNSGHPSGLYFVDAETRKAALISASEYDWHCNISRDGKQAVVDTEPPRHRQHEADGRIISDIVLIDVATGDRRWLARSHAFARHPWHPHPHITPDGKYVIYNDYEHDGAGQASRVVVAEI